MGRCLPELPQFPSAQSSLNISGSPKKLLCPSGEPAVTDPRSRLSLQGRWSQLSVLLMTPVCVKWPLLYPHAHIPLSCASLCVPASGISLTPEQPLLALAQWPADPYPPATCSGHSASVPRPRDGNSNLQLQGWEQRRALSVCLSGLAVCVSQAQAVELPITGCCAKASKAVGGVGSGFVMCQKSSTLETEMPFSCSPAFSPASWVEKLREK